MVPGPTGSETRGPIGTGATGDRRGTECRALRLARPVPIRSGPQCTRFMPPFPPLLRPPSSTWYLIPTMPLR